MKIALDSFRGETPRVTPRELPINAAQEATNARLQTGDLESWRQFLLTKTLANTGPVQTIYLLNGSWLSWNDQVDVARGLIAGDNTFRTYLTAPTLYATPRFTNYALATTGAEPFPVATRPLGVPGPTIAPTLAVGVDPTPTTFSVDTTDAGNELATEWHVSGRVSLEGGSTYSEALQSATVGNPLPSYELRADEIHNQGEQAWLYRNFGIKKAAVVRSVADFMLTGGTPNVVMIVGAGEDGAGVAVKYENGLLEIGASSAWSPYGMASIASVAAVVAQAAWYTLRADVVVNADNSKTVTATILLGAAVVATITGSGSFDSGDFVGFSSAWPDDHPTYYQVNVDNIHVTASGSTDYVAQNVATSYVYTYGNDLLEESPPSPASLTILRPDGISVTVTTPTTTPVVGDAATYTITTKWIYRAISGASGTVFVLVTPAAGIPLAQATFVDQLDDSEIAGNDVLESDEWDPPPPTLQGIIALPNGIMAGFFRNLLCLSAAGRPHAWPVRFRYPTDTDIVAIANIDNTVVIGTKSFLYTATGNSPDAYSMSKPGDPQACVAKRSMVFVPDVGVVYASPDGWMVCAGSAGQVRNVTEGIFTKRQWTALTPSSIIAAVHDGVLFFFSTGQTPDSGYALDTKQSGFGLIRLSFHATAVHTDPLTDALYLVLDVNNEPTATGLPVASTAVVPTGLKIFQFDAGASDMVFRWRGRLNLSPYPLALTIAQVRALAYTNLLVRFYGDGVLIYEKVLANAREFVIPAFATYGSYELELMGTSTARTAQAAEDVMELG
jgi:hypothetical protein